MIALNELQAIELLITIRVESAEFSLYDHGACLLQLCSTPFLPYSTADLLRSTNLNRWTNTAQGCLLKR